MDTPMVLARIEERLRPSKCRPMRPSRAAGAPDAIRNLRRAVKNGGRQGVTMTTLAALAPVLQTTAGYLLEGGESSAMFDAVSEARRPTSIPVVASSLQVFSAR